MKNILVPVDFSELSKVAARYAVGLASASRFSVKLFSVQEINPGPHALLNKYRLEEEMERAAQEDGAALVQELKSLASPDLEISFATHKGWPVHSIIEHYAEAHPTELIVMGSRGAHGLEKIFPGSNTTAVINNSKVPVLVVPGNAVYHGIKNIVYATDMTHVDSELRQLQGMINPFGALLHIIHVVTEGAIEETDPANIASGQVITVPYATRHFHVFKSTPVAEAIDDFVETHQADLLAVFTHKLELFEKLFDTSVTRQLAFHSRIPLLSFNKTTGSLA